MFVHAVYFWLRDDLTPDELSTYTTKLEALAGIESVTHCYIGTPAATDRPIIDRSYSYALVVIFEDEAAHDAYQADPIHDDFRDSCASFWTRVQIYDSIG